MTSIFVQLAAVKQREKTSETRRRWRATRRWAWLAQMAKLLTWVRVAMQAAVEQVIIPLDISLNSLVMVFLLSTNMANVP